MNDRLEFNVLRLPESYEGIPVMKKNIDFDEEEHQILQDFENGEFESLRNFRQEKRDLEEAAASTLHKLAAGRLK